MAIFLSIFHFGSIWKLNLKMTAMKVRIHQKKKKKTKGEHKKQWANKASIVQKDKHIL